MRRWIAVMVAAVAGLVLAAPAQAGTYDVVSCGAPGAGGVNRAWVGEIIPAGSPFQIADCGPELLGATSSTKQTAGYFSGANWTFTTPAGTTISRLVTWRYAQLFCCNGWGVAAYQANGSIVGGGFGGETCVPPEGFTPCTFGATGGVSPASRAQYDIAGTNRIFYSVGCGNSGGCATANDSGQRFAEYHVYGTAVTVRDDTAPRLTLGGPLLTAGWRKPGQPADLTFSATDATGIRRVRLTGAATAINNRSCDFRRPAPCSAASGKFAPQLPEGVHRLTVTAEDAAGNPNALARTVRIDGTPPNARIAVAKGRTILVDVTDNVAGVKAGRIAVRGSAGKPFRDLPTTLSGGRLRARMDRGRAQRSQIRVTVEDEAGNAREGLGTSLRITKTRAGRRSPRVRGGRVTLPNGRRATLTGRLKVIRGGAVAGALVVATTAVSRKGAPARELARVTTTRSGRFTVRIPKGPSRVLRLSTPGRGGALGATGRLSVRIPARSSIRASRTSLGGPGVVRFSGRVRGLGAGFPTRGIVLALQGREDGRWRTFEDLRTDRRGRWAKAHQFRGVPGTYPIRVRIRHQARFPFVLGYSPAVKVRIR
jgi:hypothetical protein